MEITSAPPPSLPSVTLWLHPCLSRKEMIERMCPSLMTLRASGLSTRTQWRTSRTPVQGCNAHYHRIKPQYYQYSQRPTYSTQQNIPCISLHNGTDVTQTILHQIYFYVRLFKMMDWWWIAQKLNRPQEASRRSSLLISQSREAEKCAQLRRFPRISAAEEGKDLIWRVQDLHDFAATQPMYFMQNGSI